MPTSGMEAQLTVTFMAHHKCQHQNPGIYVIYKKKNLKQLGEWEQNIPHKLDKFSHNYARAHKMQCQPCTFARAFVGSPCPWAQHMIPHLHSSSPTSSPAHGGQGISATAAASCRRSKGTSQWTCTAQCLPSSHALCPRCRTWTCRSRFGTCYFSNSF